MIGLTKRCQVEDLSRFSRAILMYEYTYRHDVCNDDLQYTMAICPDFSGEGDNLGEWVNGLMRIFSVVLTKHASFVLELFYHPQEDGARGKVDEIMFQIRERTQNLQGRSCDHFAGRVSKIE